MNQRKKIARIVHIGRKAPKGFKELPGGIHLGKGIWILPIEPIKKRNPNSGSGG